MSAADWPAPYLQPDRNQDCGFYATAYIVRCLGAPDVTAGEVKAWRESTRYHETAYPRDVTGAQTRTWASLEVTSSERAEYYMGPGGEAWVRRWLAEGWIGYATVFRVPGMAHAVAVLGADDDGVLLMDPLVGHVTEPWDWFLGIGPGKYGCHYIESWYRSAATRETGAQAMREGAEERERIKAMGGVSACCGATYTRPSGRYERWHCDECGGECDLIGVIG